MQGLFGWLLVIRRESEREREREREDKLETVMSIAIVSYGWLWLCGGRCADGSANVPGLRWTNGDYQVKSDIQCLLLDEIGQVVFVWFVGAVPASISPTDWFVLVVSISKSPERPPCSDQVCR